MLEGFRKQVVEMEKCQVGSYLLRDAAYTVSSSLGEEVFILK